MCHTVPRRPVAAIHGKQWCKINGHSDEVLSGVLFHCRSTFHPPCYNNITYTQYEKNKHKIHKQTCTHKTQCSNIQNISDNHRSYLRTTIIAQMLPIEEKGVESTDTDTYIHTHTGRERESKGRCIRWQCRTECCFYMQSRPVLSQPRWHHSTDMETLAHLAQTCQASCIQQQQF